MFFKIQEEEDERKVMSIKTDAETFEEVKQFQKDTGWTNDRILEEVLRICQKILKD